MFKHLKQKEWTFVQQIIKIEKNDLLYISVVSRFPQLDQEQQLMIDNFLNFKMTAEKQSQVIDFLIHLLEYKTQIEINIQIMNQERLEEEPFQVFMNKQENVDQNNDKFYYESYQQIGKPQRQQEAVFRVTATRTQTLKILNFYETIIDVVDKRDYDFYKVEIQNYSDCDIGYYQYDSLLRQFDQLFFNGHAKLFVHYNFQPPLLDSYEWQEDNQEGDLIQITRGELLDKNITINTLYIAQLGEDICTYQLQSLCQQERQFLLGKFTLSLYSTLNLAYSIIMNKGMLLILIQNTLCMFTLRVSVRSNLITIIIISLKFQDNRRHFIFLFNFGEIGIFYKKRISLPIINVYSQITQVQIQHVNGIFSVLVGKDIEYLKNGQYYYKIDIKQNKQVLRFFNIIDQTNIIYLKFDYIKSFDNKIFDAQYTIRIYRVEDKSDIPYDQFYPGLQGVLTSKIIENFNETIILYIEFTPLQLNKKDKQTTFEVDQIEYFIILNERYDNDNKHIDYCSELRNLTDNEASLTVMQM